MNIDFVFLNNSDKSTYISDKVSLKLNLQTMKKYDRIERIIEDSEKYSDLVKFFEIKQLDSLTGLMEIKLDKIRVLHFFYDGNTIVLLGTFLKKSKKTPQNIIQKNNLRIKKYKERKFSKE